MTQAFEGIFNILATPFNADGAVDTASLRHLVNFQLDRGAMGLTILGVLGEAGKLTLKERRDVMDTVMEANNGRVPVIVGTSHEQADSRIFLSQKALEAGASGVMIAPPRMSKPPDEEIIALYAQVAAAVPIAIIVQDFPPVNGITMTPKMLAHLAEQIPQARTLKLEDPPLMEKITAVKALSPHWAIFGGLGGMFLLEELHRGAAGTMTGFAFTEVLIAVYTAYRAGDSERAAAIFDRYLPLIRYENQPSINLTIRKELLYRRKAIAHPALRQSSMVLTPETHAELTQVLQRVGISDAALPLNFDQQGDTAPEAASGE